ncbi:hypothetical protein D030_3234A, partial [Vibrio parahaemolyticus AQ3810]
MCSYPNFAACSASEAILIAGKTTR